jgi:hypothetical protein
VVELPCRPSDSPRQIEIEQEILTEAPARADPIARDDLAQRRQRGLGWIG